MHYINPQLRYSSISAISHGMDDIIYQSFPLISSLWFYCSDMHIFFMNMAKQSYLIAVAAANTQKFMRKVNIPMATVAQPVNGIVISVFLE